MGPTGSVPKLDPSQRTIKVTNAGATNIPFKLPPNCKLTSVNLNGNKIRELPSKLTRIQQLSLAKNGLITISPQIEEAISSYLQLEFLDLSFNDLKFVPQSFIKLRNLKTIHLFGNKISSFPLSETPIETIDLARNNLTEIPKFNNKLVNLSMEANKIVTVCAVLPNLVKLTLSYNSIEQIVPEAHFKMLESLDLSNNLLRNCPNFMKQTPRLRRIDLSHNFIEEIPQLPRSLSVLLMSDNRLQSLPSDFSQLPYIVHIDFSHNLIDKIPKLPMSIQIVDLSQNRITYVEPAETPDLVELRIHHNLLTSLPKFTSNQVVELSLNSNKITAIDVTILNPNITMIDLSDNLIKEVPDELFDLQNLFSINLSRNMIRTLPPKISSSEVIFLMLSRNPIEDLPELPQSIEVIDLADCKLREMPQSIALLNELVQLSCPNNKLKSFPSMPSLQQLNLSKNRFRTIPDLPLSLVRLDISMNQIKELPPILPPELNDLDIAFNKITKFPDNFSSQSLARINLYGNPLDDSMDIGQFPKLKILNVSQTKTIVKGNVRKLQSFTCHDESLLQMNQCVLECGHNSCFISTAGKCSTSEDTPLVRMRFTEDISVFGIFHAHESLSVSIAAASEMNTLLGANKNNFDGDIIDTLTTDIFKIADTSQSYKESALTIGIIKKSTLLISQVGFIRAAVIMKDGNVYFTTANTAPKSVVRSPFVNREDLGLLRALGRRTVFGQNATRSTESFIIEPNSKFIVLASENLFDDFPPSVLSEMALKANSARDFAYDIHNSLFSYLRKANSTVYVASLEPDSLHVP